MENAENTQEKMALEKVVDDRTHELSSTLIFLEDTISELNDSQHELNRNNFFKAQITSAVLHDIRSPLAYLDKVARSIYDEVGEGDTRLKKKIFDLFLSIKNVAGYSHNLLVWMNMHEPVAGPAQDTPILPLFQDLVEKYKPLADHNNDTLAYTVADNLRIKSHPDLLNIIVRNLLDNAIKFTKNGSIKLNAMERGQYIHLSVTDTGVGLSKTDTDQLLNDDNSTRNSYQGGFGYRFIKDIVYKLKGRVEIESEVGSGTKVTIILPKA